MSEINEERKDRLRQTEDYKKTKEIFDRLISNVSYVSPMKVDLFPPSFRERLLTFEKNCVDFYEKWKESEKVSEILRGLKSEVSYDNNKLKSMSKMLAYLGLIESLGVALVDMTLILLIANGKDVHIRWPYTKHATSFEDLERIELGYKLDILDAGGFDLFKKFMNRVVRNHIAHLKFTIQNNGEIRKKDGSPIRIDEEISRFWDGVDTIKLILDELRFFKTLEKLSSLKFEEKESALSHE